MCEGYDCDCSQCCYDDHCYHFACSLSLAPSLQTAIIIPCGPEACLTLCLTNSDLRVFVKVTEGQNVKYAPTRYNLQKHIAKQPYFMRYRVRSFDCGPVCALYIVRSNRIIGVFLAISALFCQKQTENSHKIHRYTSICTC